MLINASKTQTVLLVEPDKFKCLDSMFIANSQDTEEIRSMVNFKRHLMNAYG